MLDHRLAERDRLSESAELHRSGEEAKVASMDPLDPNQQLRSPDLLHGGSPLDHRSQANAYPQTYSDPSLLAFPGAEHGLGSPPLAFPPPDHSALQYALSANALASAQQQQHHQQLQQDSGKKDIKRRTKTGCLTCRKRRIKCDEAQPECNNCRKSKRTCQGYDPLFRNQQSPASIQPASRNSKQSVSHQHSTVQNAYPPPPAGYAAVQSPAYPIATMSHVPNDTATFDFSAAIDPALQSHGHVNMNQAAGSANLFAPNDQVYQTDVRPSTIEELMQIGAPYPDVTNAPGVTEDKKPDIKSLFGYYGPGLNKFLETQWYQQNAWSHIQQNPLLLDKYALLLSRMEYTAEQAPYENQINLTVEAHMIWETLELSKLVAQATNAGSNVDNDSTQSARQGAEPGGHIGVHETATRFEVLKTLITNTYLDPSILEVLATYDSNVPPNINNLSKQLLNRERKFWRNTAKFLTLNIDTTSPDVVDAALLDMRGLLESKENRDIIYSVAIMRVWPRRLMDQENRLRNEGNVNPQLDAENVKKVEVAKVFLTQQAGGRGTTPASQRICDMITKAWHPPPFAL